MVQNAAEKSIEEETQKVAAEVQLQQYGTFLNEFRSTLGQIQKSLPVQSGHPSKSRIHIDFQPEEQIESTQELINSENKIIDKVLTVFCTLCDEVSFIEDEANSKYLDTIAYYGESLEDNTPYEDCQLLISKTLPVLQDLSNFVTHCERIILDILTQLAAFYRLHFEITDAHLYHVFDALSNLLLTLIILEETLNSNGTLSYHWSLYKRTLQLAQHRASEFPYKNNEIRQLSKLISRIESHLLSKRIFETILHSDFDKKQPVKMNKRLEEEFATYLKTLSSELDRTINKENRTDIRKLTKFTLAFVLFLNMFGSCDRKMLKTLADILKKFPLVTLRCNVLLPLENFILRHAGSFLKAAEKKWFERDQQQYTRNCLAEVTTRMNRDVQHYTIQILCWILKLESSMAAEYEPLKMDYLEDVSTLLLDGISYCRRIKALLTTVSNLHISVSKAMSRVSALSFCKLVELIKCVDTTYTRYQAPISRLINHVVQYMEYQCLLILSNCKKNMGMPEKCFKEIRVDAMSSLVTAENCLLGSPTHLRLTVTTLCLNLATQIKCLNDSDRHKLYDLLSRLETTTSLLRKVHDVAECKFMYWNKSTWPWYLEDVIKRQLNLDRIQYMLSALENGQNDQGHRSLDNQIQDIPPYSDITNTFVEHVTAPTCAKMEENLRLHTLVHLQLEKPMLTQLQNDLKNFTLSQKLLFNGKCLDLKFQVECYLDRTFYDLATVALHDWQIYGEMRTLAKHKFKLKVAEDGLPNHTLEQGPDLLHITRNIHVFVANHFYNLNNQVFIETGSNNKHLNVINIKHTANSIRTHGAGIMSTAVNYTYQFLSSKLTHFSQFLYDEQVKSRLLKEVSYCQDQQANFKYPFERAETLHRGMRKLGIKQDGSTCLDQFRLLITHMGNALGYVRLIRSGGLRYFSNAICFVPDLKHIADFESLCTDHSGFSNCKPSAINLNNVVHNMCLNMTEGTNYFKLLVDVIHKVLDDPRNDHLKNFYAVVPALTINFVEHMITAKEGLSKKNSKCKVTFTDDGFSMGVAYMLHTLKQYSNFESLQWFPSVGERNENVKNDLLKQLVAVSKDDLKLNHTLNLSLKRLEVYQQEFQLLYYNLYSAQVLFHGHSDREENEEGVV